MAECPGPSHPDGEKLPFGPWKGKKVGEGGNVRTGPGFRASFSFLGLDCVFLLPRLFGAKNKVLVCEAHT